MSVSGKNSNMPSRNFTHESAGGGECDRLTLRAGWWASSYRLRDVAVSFVYVLFATAVYSVHTQHVCPADKEENIKDAFGFSGDRRTAVVQQGIWHRVLCPTFRPGELLDGVIWYKGSDINDPSKVRLISRSVSEVFPADERYAFSSDSSLVIKGVQKSDEGSLLCQVIPQETGFRVAKIDLQVLDNSFPPETTDSSSSARFERGRRQTLPCHCAPRTLDEPPSVVYWSTGEGFTADTEIIGARFADGTVLQIQHGADYSIDSSTSLIVNSLNDVNDTQRFWCHLFQPDGALTNCFTNVQITDQDGYPANRALRASERSFYLLQGKGQILPCLNRPSGEASCEVQWFKGSNLNRQNILTYNLPANFVGADASYDLASDFGLVIESADSGHAGRYSCVEGLYTTDNDISVSVIGDKFPLDGGIVVSTSCTTLRTGGNYALTCPAVMDAAETKSEGTLIWSFGGADDQMTTVIGMLNLPDGSETMSDLGDSGFSGISLNGSLLLTGSLQVGDVRFWCHVFTQDGLLLRSYVDAIIRSDVQPQPCNSGITIVLTIICVVQLVAIIAILVVVYLTRRRRKRRKRRKRLECDNNQATYTTVIQAPTSCE